MGRDALKITCLGLDLKYVQRFCPELCSASQNDWNAVGLMGGCRGRRFFDCVRNNSVSKSPKAPQVRPSEIMDFRWMIHAWSIPILLFFRTRTFLALPRSRRNIASTLDNPFACALPEYLVEDRTSPASKAGFSGIQMKPLLPFPGEPLAVPLRCTLGQRYRLG